MAAWPGRGLVLHQALAAVALRQSKLVYRGKINPVRRFQEIWLRSAV